MSKVLIYLEKNKLAPTGGPNGYNYNLKKGLDLIKSEIIVDYLNSESIWDNTQNVKKVNRLNDRIKKIGGCLKAKYGLSHESVTDLNEYDAVHFQSTYSMYKVRDSLKNYKGKILLQSHTPTRPSEEAYDIISEHGKLKIKWAKRILDCADEYAFKRADYIIFPCAYAEEPYYNHWPKYEVIKKESFSKYRYVMTGTEGKLSKKSRSAIRNSLGIPDDGFIISYVGRHNEIKGYDLLKQIGNDLLTADENTYFLIAGKEEPIHGLDNDRWIEIGWTNDPHSYVSASDIFVLPNRETYFDLVLLEVLSLGQIVLISNTGGNKFFKKYSGNGIFLYDTVEEAVEIINDLKHLGAEQISIMKENNRRLYKTCFANSVFAKNYISLLEEILV